MVGHVRDGKGPKVGRFGVGRGNLLFCFSSRCPVDVQVETATWLAGWAILAEFGSQVWAGGKISRVCIKQKDMTGSDTWEEGVDTGRRGLKGKARGNMMIKVWEPVKE